MADSHNVARPGLDNLTCGLGLQSLVDIIDGVLLPSAMELEAYFTD